MHQGQKSSLRHPAEKAAVVGGADYGLLDHMGFRPADAWRGEKDSTLVGCVIR